MQPIFEYSDYRKLLRDFCDFKKVSDPGFSHRAFLSKAGMTGPNFLKNVMDGRKNLSRDGITRFAAALGLKKRESDYFNALVLWNQAKNPVTKRRLFIKLCDFAERSETVRLEQRQFDYLGTWYAVAVREYIHAHGFSGDYTALARSIYPKISERQAKKAVELLVELGLVIRDGSGTCAVTGPLVSTGAEISGIAAHKYHESMASVAGKAIRQVPQSHRYFRGVTYSCSDEANRRITLELNTFVQRAMDIIASDQGDGKTVRQINMQMFPLEPVIQRRRKQP